MRFPSERIGGGIICRHYCVRFLTASATCQSVPLYSSHLVAHMLLPVFVSFVSSEVSVVEVEYDCSSLIRWSVRLRSFLQGRPPRWSVG